MYEVNGLTSFVQIKIIVEGINLIGQADLTNSSFGGFYEDPALHLNLGWNLD